MAKRTMYNKKSRKDFKPRLHRQKITKSITQNIDHTIKDNVQYLVVH